MTLGLDRRADDRSPLQPGRRRRHADPFPAAVRGAADLRRAARRSTTRTLEAARDLGARPRRVFRDIVLPQTQAGLIAAFTLAFLDSRRRLRDAAPRRRPRHPMVGNFIEIAVRATASTWPQGAAMAYHDHGGLRAFPDADASRPCAPRCGSDDAGPRTFGGRGSGTSSCSASSCLLLTPLVLVVLFAFAANEIPGVPARGGFTLEMVSQPLLD